MSNPSTSKVVFVGNTRVGKTSLINYYIKRDASPTTSTLGATSTKVETSWENTHIPMTVWDTAGQDTFRNLVPIYARGAHAAVIVFNQHSEKSWASVSGWYDYLSDVETAPNCITVLVSNKTDKDAKVDMTEVYQWAASKHIEVIRTSAVEGTGVDMVFQTIAKELARRINTAPSPEQPTPEPPERVDPSAPTPAKKRCAC